MPISLKKITGITLAAILITPSLSNAEDQVRRYRTLEERRDAGQKHTLAEWLYLSPLIELEYLKQTFKPYDLNDFTVDENSKTLQLDIEIIPADGVMAQIVYEYDDLLDEFLLDEALVEFEFTHFKLEAGKLYLPFGEYYSRFVTGPLLEFGETRARSLVFSYEPDDSIEAALFIFKSKIEHIVFHESSLDWGFSINFSPVESVSTGLSYVSDLSESDEKLLDDSFIYQHPVDAISAYINIEFNDMDASIEWLQAMDSFTELDPDRNHPRAWNMEIASFLNENFEIALRIEGSKELEDAPELQAGIASTWHASRNIMATVEFLRGRFKRGLATDANDNELDKQNVIAAQLGISF